MYNIVLILVAILTSLSILYIIGEQIFKIVQRVKMKQREKEWKEKNIENDFEEIRHRLDCHSETIGQINWKVSEMEEKLNDKKVNRTKRNK